MARSCDFCVRANEYICDPDDHCGMCLMGQKALGQAVRQPKRPSRNDLSRDERRDD